MSKSIVAQVSFCMVLVSALTHPSVALAEPTATPVAKQKSYTVLEASRGCARAYFGTMIFYSGAIVITPVTLFVDLLDKLTPGVITPKGSRPLPSVTSEVWEETENATAEAHEKLCAERWRKLEEAIATRQSKPVVETPTTTVFKPESIRASHAL